MVIVQHIKFSNFAAVHSEFWESHHAATGPMKSLRSCSSNRLCTANNFTFLYTSRYGEKNRYLGKLTTKILAPEKPNDRAKVSSSAIPVNRIGGK